MKNYNPVILDKWTVVYSTYQMLKLKPKGVYLGTMTAHWPNLKLWLQKRHSKTDPMNIAMGGPVEGVMATFGWRATMVLMLIVTMFEISQVNSRMNADEYERRIEQYRPMLGFLDKKWLKDNKNWLNGP